MTNYGPDLDLQAAIVDALTDSAALTALVSTRIYQDAPPGNWPGDYVTLGEGQVLDASDECSDAVEVLPVIHAWSRRGTGFFEVKRMAHAIKSALHNATLTLENNVCFSIMLESAVIMRDPDGITKHAALTFRARIEPAA